MHDVGFDVLEQPLIVGDNEERALGVAQRVDALGDDPQGVYVQPGVGLVEDRQARGEQRHLQHFRALLFAAGETDVYRPLEHIEIDLEALRRSAGHRAHEVGRREIALPRARAFVH